MPHIMEAQRQQHTIRTAYREFVRMVASPFDMHSGILPRQAMLYDILHNVMRVPHNVLRALCRCRQRVMVQRKKQSNIRTVRTMGNYMRYRYLSTASWCSTTMSRTFVVFSWSAVYSFVISFPLLPTAHCCARLIPNAWR